MKYYDLESRLRVSSGSPEKSSDSQSEDTSFVRSKADVEVQPPNQPGMTLSQDSDRSAPSQESFISDAPFEFTMHKVAVWFLRRTRADSLLAFKMVFSHHSVSSTECVVLNEQMHLVDDALVLPKSYVPYAARQRYTWVKPGQRIDILNGKYQLDVLEGSLGFEWITGIDAPDEVISLSTLRLRKPQIHDFEKMHSTFSEHSVPPNVIGDSSDLQNEGRVIIFGGAYHGKSTFVEANVNSAEVEMKVELAEQRFDPDIAKAVIDLAPLLQGAKTDPVAFDNASKVLFESDTPIILSHLSDTLLELALESGRMIAFVTVDWLEIRSRSEADAKDNGHEFAISRLTASMAYYQNLLALNIQGPLYPNFEQALSALLGEVSLPTVLITQDESEGNK